MIQVWLFYPEGSVATKKDTIRIKCEARGWTLVHRNTVRKSVQYKGRDIRAYVIHQQHATELYSEIHRGSVGVLQLSDTHVPITPNPKKRDYVPLSTFVRYKAFFHPIREDRITEQTVDQIANSFQEWIDLMNCTGEDDPRCLPFHVFCAKEDGYNLNIIGDRQRFESHHRMHNFRRDGNDLDWKRPVARQMHGRETLQVAGRELIRGFHWDVSNGAGSQRIYTTSEIWQLGPRGYVNIYPDAYIRGKQAKRIFPPRGKQNQSKKKPA